MGLNAVALLCLTCAGAAPGTGQTANAAVLYEALFGEAKAVEASRLMAAPGRFAGHPVRTQGRLVKAESGGFVLILDLDLNLGQRRAALRLEPEMAAAVAARASSWADRIVEVEGFFYRDGSAVEAYALRAWHVRPAGGSSPAEPARGDRAVALSLEDLVYSSGRHDGRLVRVRGRYRGANLHRDLPEWTRKGSRDWVLKDAHFAAWVTGREARGEGWDLTQRSLDDTDAALEVVGVPTTSGGVVRIAAREVEISLAPPTGVLSRALPSGDAGLGAVPPRVSFAYPPPGTALLPPGHLVIQFSKSMDPATLEAGLRVRYERPGVAPPRVRVAYRDRYRALVVTPDPPPPPDTEVVVELLQGVIDVDGRALKPRTPAAADSGGDVVEQVRFRSGP